jgi:hypothetical protein
MRVTTAFGLALAISLASLSATYATEDVPTATHPYHHHRVHHRLPAVRDTVPAPAPVVGVPPLAPQGAPLGLAWPRIAPYPDNRGDEDGLSEDQNDCNKGCIDGNTPD